MDFVPWTDSLNRICQKWETFACSLGISTLSPLLYQHITDVLFETIIKESLSVSTSTGDTQDSGLTFEEESAIHYVGGYVIRELKLDKANTIYGKTRVKRFRWGEMSSDNLLISNRVLSTFPHRPLLGYGG